jgi:HlyD family secretion protein
MFQHLMNRYTLLFVCMWSLTACSNKEEKTRPVLEAITESVYASGVVKSRNQYQLFPTVSGIVQQVLVKEGEVVQQGDPLLIIENTAARLRAENARIAAEFARVSTNTEKLQELQAAIALARSSMENDSLLLARQRTLWSSNIGSRLQLEQRELAYKNSRTAYESALLRYQDLKKQLDFAARQARKNLQISEHQADEFVLRSETKSRIFSLLKEKGELVSPQTPVAILGDADTFMLELQVDEYDIARIRPGQKVFLNLDSYRGQVFEARIEKINPAMNERTRSFVVEASFVRAPPVLYPNLTAEANIIIRQKEKALTIPRDYLLDDSFVLRETGERVPVKTGIKDYQKVEILDGISQEDVLVKPRS